MNSVPERPNDCPEYTDERLSEMARRTVTNPIESIAMCAEMMKMRDCYTNEVARLVADANIRSGLFEDDDAAITRLLRENQRLHEELEEVKARRDTLERENVRMFREINSGPKLPDDVRFVLSLAMTGLDHTNLLPEQYTEARATISRVSSYLAKLPAPPRPNWDDAPSWAMAHVYNCHGSGLRVETDNLSLNSGGGSGWLGAHLGMGSDYSGYQLPIGVDWRTTLRKRPDPLAAHWPSLADVPVRCAVCADMQRRLWCDDDGQWVEIECECK